MSADKEKKSKHEERRQKAELKAAQIELVKLQRHVIATGQQILVILEGRRGGREESPMKRLSRPYPRRSPRVLGPALRS